MLGVMYQITRALALGNNSFIALGFIPSRTAFVRGG